MISHSLNGCPLPVGAPFRQRTLYAEKLNPRRDGPFPDGVVPWTVSVVGTRRGPIVEAKFHMTPHALVASDLAHHSMPQDVLAKTLPLLDSTDGWRDCTVPPCEVPGCTRPLPMWAVEGRGIHGAKECLVCAVRTVLACVECGAPDSGQWAGREQLLVRSLCLDCGHWLRRVADPPKVVTDDWQVYGIGKGGGPASCRGFGGTRFTVTFHDGRVVETDDLWAGGQVPEWFRDRFQPNAVVALRAPQPSRPT